MTKKEIVRTISEEIGLTQLQTKEIVQKTFDAIVEALVAERRIELRNFGVFEVKRRAPRKARNPRTGDKVFVPEKYVVTFKPGKEMEERVKELERQAAAAARVARVKTAGKEPAAEAHGANRLAPQRVTAPTRKNTSRCFFSRHSTLRAGVLSPSPRHAEWSAELPLGKDFGCGRPAKSRRGGGRLPP